MFDDERRSATVEALDDTEAIAIAGSDMRRLLRDALRRGLDTRMGLEDTTREPDGAVTAGNAALVRAATRLVG